MHTSSHEAVVVAALHGGGLACLARFRADREEGLTRLASPLPVPDTGIWLVAHRVNRENARIRASGGWFRTGQEWQIGVLDSGGSALFNLDFGSSAVVVKAIHASSRPAAPFLGAKRRSVLSVASAGKQAN